MNDFDFDVMQKKQIARGASHRKNGSRSKKCSLPHDNYTERMIAKMAGEVQSWRLNAPMRWAEFKEMPADLQREYITRLRARYDVNYDGLSRMFGVTRNAITCHFRTVGLQEPHRRRVTDEAAWARFLSGEDDASDETAPDAGTPAAPVTPAERLDGVESPETSAPTNSITPLYPGSVEITVTGDANSALASVFAAAAKLLPPDGRYRVTLVALLDEA